jgi:hypothetical protein
MGYWLHGIRHGHFKVWEFYPIKKEKILILVSVILMDFGRNGKIRAFNVI